MSAPSPRLHSHAFLDARHARSERNVWGVIALSAAMMAVEIVGGTMFGSLALVADGFHMSTHVGALLLAALAYALARRHADNSAFTFGPGKFGDLAGFASALILGVIALGILVEAAQRLWAPTPIDFAQAIPIAALGLIVNLASAWLLMRGGAHDHAHGHGHGHDHAHGHGHDHDHGHGHVGEHRHGDESIAVRAGGADLLLGIVETHAPPRFRLKAASGPAPAAGAVTVETIRPDGARQIFAFAEGAGFLDSVDVVPEPHEFEVELRVGDASARLRFAEPSAAPAALAHDHNMRAAVMHVIGDAAVSVFVILGLTLARLFGWMWMDPLAGMVGALVIASWSWTLIRDTARVLLDMNPDPPLAARLRARLEAEGDTPLDLHLWRVGPGHLAAIVSLETSSGREADDYRRLAHDLFPFAHLTVEIARRSDDGRSAGAPRRVA